MRCFLAIEISEEAKKELERIQKFFPEQGIKIVEPQNLHLTLKFFGEIDDYKVSKIKKTLEGAKFEKIACKLGGIGFFPSPNYIRVVWVSLEPGDEIKKLQEKVESLLGEQGFKKEKRFETHVTLARVKFLKEKDKFLGKIKEIEVNPIESSISSLFLKKSTLTKKGPIYETIKEFKT
jgi:2'-5' RNA ligase